MSADIAVVLAAGQGTRVKSSLPKVLHPLAGKPIIERVLSALEAAGLAKPIVVVGGDGGLIREQLGARATYVEQRSLAGTGDAARVALGEIPADAPRALIVHGDEPMIGSETYRRMLQHQTESSAAIVLLTTDARDTRHLGRLVRDSGGRPSALLQESELSPEQLSLTEVNLGAYVIDLAFLRRALLGLKPHAPKGEYFLTDIVGTAVAEGLKVEAVNLPDGEDLLGINSLPELERAGKVIFRRKALALMAAGVTIVDSESTFVEDDVEVQPDTVILPFSLLRGTSRIGRGCTIGPFAHIRDSSIGDHCRIEASTIHSAWLANGVRVGPYSHVRPGSELGSSVEVGTHAEIKSSSLGAGTRMHHFGYIGDAEIGKDVNIGAGTVTCNYDGKAKHRTTIGDRAFIGSDTMLRAPVRVGEEAVTGAGSVVLQDVRAGSSVAGVPAREIAVKSDDMKPDEDGREGD